MDDTHEGILLIGTAMILFVIFLITILVIMLIYRKRKLEHVQEVAKMNEHFSREFLQAQLEIQQRTMQEIGREIHDNVGQKLTLASLYAQSFETPSGLPGVREKIDHIAVLINDSLTDLRNLSKELTDPGFSADDLVTLLAREIEKINALGICRMEFTTNNENIETGIGVNNFIFRILQEFIQNSLRHASCHSISIDFLIDDKELRISARDDGKGFDPSASSGNHGIGLTNMKKRASLIGASFRLESAPGKGARLFLIVPRNKLT